MTFEIDPNLIENNKVRLTEDGSGNLAIEHVPTANTITVDQDVAISDIATDTLPSNLDAQGHDINNVGSLSTDDVYLGQVDSTPTDSEIGDGNTAFYAKTDGNLYKRPYAGTESQISGGSGLLSSAGYSSDDTLWGHSSNIASASSTSTDSYSRYQEKHANVFVQWNDFVPSNAQGRLVAHCSVGSGEASNTKARLFNNTDSEIIAEVVSPSSNNFTIGPVDYTPPTTSDEINIFLEFASRDNSNTVTMFRAHVLAGSKL
jgi:hypothetical protein